MFLLSLIFGCFLVQSLPCETISVPVGRLNNFFKQYSVPLSIKQRSGRRLKAAKKILRTALAITGGVAIASLIFLYKSGYTLSKKDPLFSAKTMDDLS